MSRVYLVDAGRYVVKFPRRDESRAELGQLRRAYRLSRDAIEADLGRTRAGAFDALTDVELPSLLLGLGYDPALCHGDLGSWNLILTPDRRLGVIDFGDVGRWDRSKDFALDAVPMLEAALAAYGDDEQLRRKVAVRQQVLPFLDLPYYLGTRDVERAGRTMRRIAHLLAERA